VAAPEGEDPEAAEHVQVAPALVVEEVAALAALVEAVEAEGLTTLVSCGFEVLAWSWKFSPWRVSSSWARLKDMASLADASI